MTPSEGKYGEPWQPWEDENYNRHWSEAHYDIHDCRDSRICDEEESVQRACDCVNALSGVSNPAAFMEAVRDTIETVTEFKESFEAVRDDVLNQRGPFEDIVDNMWLNQVLDFLDFGFQTALEHAEHALRALDAESKGGAA